MGDGIASGVVTPKQEGVITYEHENFPIIPKYLLNLTPDRLQRGIERVVESRKIEEESLFANQELLSALKDTRIVLECAKLAVERANEAHVKGEKGT